MYFFKSSITKIVLFVFYFVLFTPISLMFKIFRRDKLQLCNNSKTSFWIRRKNKNLNYDYFKKQI